MRVPTFVTSALDSVGFSPDGRVRSRVNSYLARRASIKHARETRPRLSFSQFGEDAVLQSLVPDDPGTYLDLGSGHPVRGSNTYALYLLGWRGVLVDALVGHVDLAREIRPGDEAIHALCGEFDGVPMAFYEFEHYELSTFSEARLLELEALGHQPRQRHELSTMSLKTLAGRLRRGTFTVLSMDLEGADLEVLRGNDWTAFAPELILIEELTPPLRSRTAVQVLLETEGYELVGICGVTSIYRFRS